MSSSRFSRAAPWLAVAAVATTGSLVFTRATAHDARAGEPAAGIRFRVSFPAEAREAPLTGRLLVAIARDERRPPIRQVGEVGSPLFGRDVSALAPGAEAIIDARTFGHPVASLDLLPAGEYWVQPFFAVYERFDRADGHTVWLPLDRGEGQSWRRKPGNLFGEPVKVRLDPGARTDVELVCDQVIPPVEPIADTRYVKRFRIRSEALSRFWGRPMEVGATVLLPEGYDEHPDVRYPVNYIQGHHSRGAPGGFGRSKDFTKLWKAPDTPRMIYVTFQHASPYYDDSYGVNSENNGPYGDALIGELLPEVERRFRTIREPWARMLSGGSTGGWIALALQVFHPDTFGGCFALCPDSPDFRYFQIVNVYDDANAYWIERGFTRVERPTRRRTDGNISAMMKDENHYELVVGDRSRSGGQWDIWEATYSPIGPDGYPKRIWDKRTGVIDHEVAEHWRENYDLRHILETRWASLGPKLVGKLHVFVGDMDDYYLNNGTRMLERFLETTTEPAYGGSVTYRRNAGHCWGPRGAELLERMVKQIEAQAPDGADLRSWRYRVGARKVY